MFDDLDSVGDASGRRFLVVRSTFTSELRDVLRSEAKLVEIRTSITARAHFRASNGWANVRLSVGGLAAVLAAIAGASALSRVDGGNIIAGVLALAVTTLTAVTTFLNPSERANAHLRAGNAYLGLENRARLFYRVELLSGKPESDLERRLTHLVDDLNELNKTSPQPGRRSFQRAKRDGFVSRRQLTTAELIDDELRATAPATVPQTGIATPAT